MGTSATNARNNLKAKFADISTEIKSDEITREIRFGTLADQWMSDLETEYRLAGRSPDTPRQWKGYVRNWIKPALGSLQAWEVEQNPRACDRLVKRCLTERSYDAAKSLRTVGTKICEFGILYGALTSNPFKNVGRLHRPEKKEIVALTAEQRVDLVVKLAAFAKKRSVDRKGRSLGARARIWFQLPELVQTMLSTGVRLGELLALTGEDIDPDAKTVTIRWHLVREPGKGIVRMRYRKGNNGELVLTVPDWSAFIWRRLKLTAGAGPLFPAFGAEWLDPSTMVNRIQEAFTAVGYGWVTSHVFRKTVATILDEAGLPTTDIADQLGNTPAVVERHYRRKRVGNTRTAEAMEELDTRATG
ncbi:tyrosine-type recombinase/integrase [Amycolatopsis sp. NPDC051372]|uniref:tyrosine-type recombinase/integrase n=1 Tax=Amycolatopsis sp. NPDC051372 TaxID=3155669 RepID=UPI00343D156C